jgi:hypothetical protein
MREDCPTGKEERLENLLHEGLELQVAEKEKKKKSIYRRQSLGNSFFLIGCPSNKASFLY